MAPCAVLASWGATNATEAVVDMAGRDTELDEEGWALFEEPKDFRPPTPPPTEVQHTCLDGDVITLRLVGSHPLWGHYLWNAAPTLSTYVEEHASLVRNKRVLELGAAAGLPSIVARKTGASSVVATDYPDPDLLQNLAHNVERYGGHVVGFIWGADGAPLLAHAPEGFDLVLLSDLIFNHQAHPALIDTLDRCMRRDGQALVFFSHHRPHLAERDLAFFTLAEERGYVCTKLQEWVLSVRIRPSLLTSSLQPMFPDDPGDAQVRATVHGYTLRHRSRDAEAVPCPS